MHTNGVIFHVGGSVSDSLTDFTGGICESYDICDYNEKEKQNRLWKIIYQVGFITLQSLQNHESIS